MTASVAPRRRQTLLGSAQQQVTEASSGELRMHGQLVEGAAARLLVAGLPLGPAGRRDGHRADEGVVEEGEPALGTVDPARRVGLTLVRRKELPPFGGVAGVRRVQESRQVAERVVVLPTA